MRADELLEQAGLRKTRQRLRILNTLIKATKPMSQEEIAFKLKGNTPNKVTIYRCMEDFLAVGLIHEAYIEARKRYYELGHHCNDTQCHPHFTCIKCGITQCMFEASVPMAKGIQKGFLVHRQQVRLQGLCPNCC